MFINSTSMLSVVKRRDKGNSLKGDMLLTGMRRCMEDLLLQITEISYLLTASSPIITLFLFQGGPVGILAIKKNTRCQSCSNSSWYTIEFVLKHSCGRRTTIESSLLAWIQNLPAFINEMIGNIFILYFYKTAYMIMIYTVLLSWIDATCRIPKHGQQKLT